GEDSLSERDLRALDAHCRTAWASRDLIADRSAALDESDEERARDDLIDLALTWADLKRRLSPDKEEEVRRLLEEAEVAFGPGVTRVRRGDLVLGRELLRSGNLDRAADHLERAAELRPQDFWAH